MRLIDADAIHIDITGGRMNGKVEFAKAIEEAIKDAPTIEAIPVEWIEQYIADETNGRKIELMHISRMLEAWREEHEID